MPDFGINAFLLTDIEGSSVKWLHHRDAMLEALAAHDRILSVAISEGGGTTFKTAGDAYFAVFETPAAALHTAIRAQTALQALDWSAVGGLAVRMAVHIGSAEKRLGDFFGPAINRAARLLALAHGGQILTTDAVAALAAAERIAVTLDLVDKRSLDDPSQAAEIYQVSAAGLRSAFPPLRGPDRRRTNLPRQGGPLIGRDVDLQKVCEHFAAERFVSITGAGGIGKTRLAIEVGHQLPARFAGAVWFAQLAQVAEPELTASALATALGLDVPEGSTPLDRICNQFRTEHALLILDNCEHVLDAASAIAERLLAETDYLCILATSQESLGAVGEQVYRLPSLSTPAESAESTDEVLASGAGAFFLTRARAADASFNVDDGCAAVLGLICRRLDGVPLALAMAAARAPSLGLEPLAKLLDQRFRILVGGKRSVVPRHQTLRAALDWSVGLLSESERAIFCSLGVFSGGFSLEAAATVLANENQDRLSVINALSSLVGKSLVEADGSGSPRYRLFETARTYAIERTAEAGESQSLSHRHARYFSALFVNCLDDWTRLSDFDFRARYAPELDNLRAAIDWASGPGGGDPGLTAALLGHSAELWWSLSLVSEARTRCATALANAPGETRTREHAGMLRCFGQCASLSATNDAIDATQRAIEAYRSLGDNVGLGAALLLLRRLLMRIHRFDAADAVSQECETLIPTLARPRLSIFLKISQGARIAAQGDLPRALTIFEDALQTSRDRGFEDATLSLLMEIVDARWALLDLDGALAAARDGLAHVRRAVFVRERMIAPMLLNLFGILVERDELNEAQSMAAETLASVRNRGDAWQAFDHFSLFAAKRGRFEASVRLAGYVIAAGAALGAAVQVNEARAHESARQLTAGALSEQDIKRLLDEGASLSHAAACDLAAN